jgi:hypothetical protein
MFEFFSLSFLKSNEANMRIAGYLEIGHGHLLPRPYEFTIYDHIPISFLDIGPKLVNSAAETTET